MNKCPALLASMLLLGTLGSQIGSGMGQLLRVTEGWRYDYTPRNMLPWGVERIGGNIVWDKNGDLVVDSGIPNGNGIRVAVLDTGIDYNHPNLSGRIVGGISFVQNVSDYMDDNGHGTQAAGVIAAIDNKAIGSPVGMAPRVSLIAVKTSRYDGYTDPGALISAIYWSADSPPNGGGANVISMSIGYLYQHIWQLEDAVRYAYGKGALLIAASGNDNRNEISYPARYDQWVVAVGAIIWNDARWVDSSTVGSNYGPELDFVAPTNVYTTNLSSGFAVFRGTSAAVPHVSGAFALIWSSKVDPPYDSDGDGVWDNFEVENKMRDTALDLGSFGKDEYYGYGLINAWYANQRPPGDVNYDLRVDQADADYVSDHRSSPPGPLGYDRRADINIDNVVDIFDLGIVSANFGKVDP